MNTKKGSPPPRPPVPKGDKFGMKQTSNSSSFSIRFKSLEEDDDEELSVLDSDKKLPKRPESSPVPIKQVHDTSQLTKLHAVSKSLDEEKLSSPNLRVAETREEKRTLLAGLKDKLSDKFPRHIDKINAISKKLEEFSGDSSPSHSNHVESPRQPKPGESTKASQEKIVLSSSFSSPNLGQTLSTVKGNTSKESLHVDEKKVNGLASPMRGSVPAIAEESKEVSPDDMEIVDDFYCEEAFEDFNGGVNPPSPESIVRQRSPMQRLIKNKNSAEVASTASPMSMSKLMKNVSEESVEYDGNVFFDPKETGKTHGSNTKVQTADELSSDNSKPSATLTSASLVPVHRLAGCVVFLFLYLIVPLPSFISGMVMGAVIASLSWTIYLWIVKPPEQKEPIKIVPFEDLPPMLFPQMKLSKPDDGKYRGWMNQLGHYDANNYHINQCHSVFVRLEGSLLRLSRPKAGVPKRAMWDETLPNPQFIHQRYLDLEGSRLYLLPPGLVEKRLWSKKYPLCVALAKTGKEERQSKGSDSSNPEDEPPGGAAKDVSGFEVITEQECSNDVLYLFARTNREKEEWYYRLLGATRGKPLANHLLEIRKALEFKPKHRRTQSDQPTRHKRHNSSDSLSSLQNEDGNGKEEIFSKRADIGTFAQYMAQLMPAEPANKKLTSPTTVRREREMKDRELSKEDRTVTGSISCDPQLVWLNALLGRCFWDFLLQNFWKEKIQEKLEKKLSKIHVPYFIEGLQVTDIDLGSEMPVIRRATKPYLDERGFWVDLDVAYDGGFRMTIETKLNLMKLKEKSKATPESPNKVNRKKSAVTDSEEEDSAESSTDEEGEETPASTGDESGGTGKKLLKYIDRITQSRYFQSATDNKYVKKAMEGVSNTRLILTVEMHTLLGTLAVNIPPPPSDRLWYGFRGNPKLRLVAKPKVGERMVTVTHVTDWIEKKLAIEFQRVFVMPNMDDVVIPLMMPGIAADSIPPLPAEISEV